MIFPIHSIVLLEYYDNETLEYLEQLEQSEKAAPLKKKELVPLETDIDGLLNSATRATRITRITIEPSSREGAYDIEDVLVVADKQTREIEQKQPKHTAKFVRALRNIVTQRKNGKNVNVVVA